MTRATDGHGRHRKADPGGPWWVFFRLEDGRPKLLGPFAFQGDAIEHRVHLEGLKGPHVVYQAGRKARALAGQAVLELKARGES